MSSADIEDDYDADFETAYDEDDDQSPSRSKRNGSEAPSTVTKVSTPWKMANKSSFEDDDLLKPITKGNFSDREIDENVIDDDNSDEGWEEEKRSKPSSAPAAQVKFSSNSTQVINNTHNNTTDKRSKPRFAPVSQPKKQTTPTGVIIRNRPLVSHAKATPTEPSAPKQPMMVPRPPAVSKPSDAGSVSSSSHQSHHSHPHPHKPVAAAVSSVAHNNKPAVPPSHIHSEPSQHSELTRNVHAPSEIERQLQVALQQLKLSRREISRLRYKLDETNSNEQNNNFKYEISQREKHIKELEKENAALKQLSKYQEKHLNELSNLDSEHEALEQEKFIATMSLHVEKLKARIVEYRNLKEDQDDRIADLNSIAKKQRMKIAKLKKTVMMMQEKGGFNASSLNSSSVANPNPSHSSSIVTNNNDNNSSSRRVMKKGPATNNPAFSSAKKQKLQSSSMTTADPANTTDNYNYDPNALLKIERRYQLQLQLTQRDLNIARTESTNKDNLRVKLEAELKSREFLIKKQLMQLKALKAQHEGLSLQYKHLLSTSETLISNTSANKVVNNNPPPVPIAVTLTSPVAARKVMMPLASPPKERARSKKAALATDSSELPPRAQQQIAGSAVFLTSESY